MYPVIFRWGDFTIHAWGLMLGLALIVGSLLLAKEAKRQSIPAEPLLDLVILAVIGGLIGGRIFYVLFYEFDFFLNNPLEIVKFWSGGLVFYGGLFGGIVAGYLYVKFKKMPFWRTADIIAPFLAFGYGVVRIGCFFNGCCYGEVTAVAWGISFPAIDQLDRHPTQIYLSVLSFLTFALLYYRLRKKSFDGQVLATYLILYSVVRGLVEVYRENLIVLPYTTIAQLISMIIFIIGSYLYYSLARRGLKSE